MRWCGDLTEIPTDEGKLQLAAVLDLHSRRCVGFAMGIHHDAELARAALCVAIAVRGGAVAGVLFHTDQGGEYTGNLFVEACRSAGVTQSMGRTGSALDNAVQRVVQLDPANSSCSAGDHFATREQARHGKSPPGSTNTTPTEGIPPTACSARSTTNAACATRTRTQHGDRRTPRQEGGMNRAETASPPLSPPPAPRQATGPPLRPQGSLPRSLRDGPAARP